MIGAGWDHDKLENFIDQKAVYTDTYFRRRTTRAIFCLIDAPYRGISQAGITKP